MDHQTQLPLGLPRKFDMSSYQLRKLIGFDRQQLARRDGEVGFVESQWARVALPRDFVTIDNDGPLVEIAGQRMRRRPRPADARYHSGLSVSGPTQSGVDVAIRTVALISNALSMTLLSRRKSLADQIHWKD